MAIPSQVQIQAGQRRAAHTCQRQQLRLVARVWPPPRAQLQRPQRVRRGAHERLEHAWFVAVISDVQMAHQWADTLQGSRGTEHRVLTVESVALALPATGKNNAKLVAGINQLHWDSTPELCTTQHSTAHLQQPQLLTAPLLVVSIVNIKAARACSKEERLPQSRRAEAQAAPALAHAGQGAPAQPMRWACDG